MQNITLEIDPKLITVGALIDLEEAKKTKDICLWLVAHAGAKMDELRALPVQELGEVGKRVAESIKAAALPKANGDNS